MLIVALFSGVSSGTETRVLAGKQPGAEFPLIPGYETVGRIVAVGEDVKALQFGNLVFHYGSQRTGPFHRAWGGQMAYAILSEADVFLIPTGLALEDATFAKVAAIARHGIWRAKVRAGEKVVIVGQGLIGHLAAQVATAFGAYVTVVDVVPERLKAALSAGVAQAIHAGEVDVVQAVHEVVGIPDVVADATGSPAALNQSIALLVPKPWAEEFVTSARFLFLGSYPAEVLIDYRLLFDREPDVIISRDNLPADNEAVMKMMSSSVLGQVFSKRRFCRSIRQHWVINYCWSEKYCGLCSPGTDRITGNCFFYQPGSREISSCLAMKTSIFRKALSTALGSSGTCKP